MRNVPLKESLEQIAWNNNLRGLLWILKRLRLLNFVEKSIIMSLICTNKSCRNKYDFRCMSEIAEGVSSQMDTTKKMLKYRSFTAAPFIQWLVFGQEQDNCSFRNHNQNILPVLIY